MENSSVLDFLYAKEKELLTQLEVVRNWCHLEELKIKIIEPHETYPTFITMKEIDEYNSKVRETAPKYKDANGVFVQIKDTVTLSELGRKCHRSDGKKGWLVAVSKDEERFYVNWWGQKTNKVYHRKYIAKFN